MESRLLQYEWAYLLKILAIDFRVLYLNRNIGIKSGKAKTDKPKLLMLYRNFNFRWS